MKRAILSAALAAALVAGVSAQDKPSFAGTWKIDPARSSQYVGGAPPETITVEGSRMTVSRTVAGNTASAAYMLDGTPSKNTQAGRGGAPVEHVYTSKWEGNVLVTTIAVPAPNPIIEKRSIEADGTMKVEVITVVRGERETGTMVFNKTR